MAKNRKITKADVLEAALEVLKTETLDDLTARRVAQQLDSSVQPIFYNFENMDELKTAAYQTIYGFYQRQMLEGAEAENSYKGMGLAYINFARDYPNYFKILFMSRTGLDPNFIIDQDNNKNRIIEAGMRMTGFDEEAQRAFHLKVWIFTHGLATLAATGTIRISDAEIERLLGETVRAMTIGERMQNEQLERREQFSQAERPERPRRGFRGLKRRNENYKAEKNDDAE